ncbi:MAG: hypothetical protein FJ096_02065 [Deltaproteobacteria bacterium]|nr:hypothetical protein [Deltaproteobacteria bacterium]
MKTFIEFEREQLRPDAEALGFELEGDRWTKRIDGQPVTAALNHRTQANELPTVIFHAPLARPLDLGLTIQTRSFAGLFGNDDPFEAEFDAKADEAERRAALLGAGLRDFLMRQHAASQVPYLSDRGAFVSTTLPLDMSAHGVGQLLALVVRSTAALAAAAKDVPPARPHAHRVSALERWATTRGLSTARTPLLVEGTVDGRPVALVSQRTDEHAYAFTIEVGFATPLGLGLAIEPGGVWDVVSALVGAGSSASADSPRLDRLGEAFGIEDRRVGHAAFDRRFQVRALNEAVAELPRRLDDKVAEEMLALHGNHGQIRVDDRRIVLEHVRSDGPTEALLELVSRVAVLAAALEGTPRVESSGPYR